MNNYQNNLSIFFDKEESWLKFSKRLLEEANDLQNPLLERLKFLFIFQDNLDEFFMLRIILVDKSLKIRQQIEDMIQWQSEIYKEIMDQLSQENVKISEFNSLDFASQKQLHSYYLKNIASLLSPIILSEQIPILKNLTCYCAIRLQSKIQMFATLEIPQNLPTLIPILNTNTCFVRTSDIISHYLDDLFSDYCVQEYYFIRITRNLRYDCSNLSQENILRCLQKKLNKRQRQQIVRVEVSRSLDKSVILFLKQYLEIPEQTIYNFMPSYFLEKNLCKLPLPHLKKKPFFPKEAQQDLFSLLKQQDILCHHPYDDFATIINWINKAAHDPLVISINITIYRVYKNSKILESLMIAVKNGKQVLVIVELKARFDEENNISWAHKLQESGVRLVFSQDLKVHAKICLIERFEFNEIKRYVHLATGNYHEKTAATYVDLGLLTTQTEIVEDVATIFKLFSQTKVLSHNFLEQHKTALENLNHIFVSPINLQAEIIRKIEDEILFQKQNKNGLIQAKLNALTEEKIIEKLYEASQKGVKIQLIVRGMCLLRPQVPNMSDNIEIISIVDRFLEHSRIFYFHAQGKRDVYLSSADWMPRNMHERIEVMFPILDNEIKSKIIDDIFSTYWKGYKKARFLLPSGDYEKRKATESFPQSAQENFIQDEQ